MQRVGLVIAAMMLVPTIVSAESPEERELKYFFEGRRVVLKIDLPATHKGLNVRPERRQPINYHDYNQKLQYFGVALREGEGTVVTKVKVKGKHIEFQLGGGGYGTFWDPSATPPSYVHLPKSRRELHLEEELAYEHNPWRRRRLERKLDALRYERHREEEYLHTLEEEAYEREVAFLHEVALEAGSRFNIRYDHTIHHAQLTPDSVLAALADYLELAEEGRSR